MELPVSTRTISRRRKGMTFVEIIIVVAIALGIAVAIVALVQKYGQKTVDTQKKIDSTDTNVPNVGDSGGGGGD